MNTPKITEINQTFEVIYIRYTGTYAGFRKESKSMVKELFEFAGKNNLLFEGETKVMTLYHDNPYISDQKSLKTSVAMTLPKNTKITEEGRISTMTFGGNYAVLEFDLKLREYDEAWNYAYQDFLFKSETLKARDDFPFELYVTEPPRNMKDTSITQIYIPIE